MLLNIWHMAQPNRWFLKPGIMHIVGYLRAYSYALLTNYY